MGMENNDTSEKTQNKNVPHVQTMLSSEEIRSLSAKDLLMNVVLLYYYWVGC
jgi:hypothetical protein